jgi:hypothetical protein
MRRFTLIDSVIVITELIDVVYEAYLRRAVATQRGKRSKAAEYHLRQFLGVHIPEIMLEHEGVDGDLVWWMACTNLAHRRGGIEERMLMDHHDAREVFEDHHVWRAFEALLKTSPAGMTWGHLESRLRKPWS